LPNLILAVLMGAIMSVIAIGDWTTAMLLIGGGTLAFIVAYTVALVLLIKRRKAAVPQI
jgi:ABC-type transport system involved in cytochrome c biogenesis permease component